MKRKTNLFYLSGDDSNFITFSNYTESLTGNFLATDWKMFPSKFICMRIKFLEDATDENDYNLRKAAFIKYIARYYENKMAFLRDYCTTNDLNTEKKLKPLNYLLEALYRINENVFEYSYTNTYVSNSVVDTSYYYNINTDNITSVDNLPTNNDNVKMTFVGDITEQDYNGVYADAIQVISSGDVNKGNLIMSSSNNDDTISGGVEYNETSYYLYGWVENNQYIGPSPYNKETPIYDYDNYYNTDSNIVGISTKANTDDVNIKFNILIPLFDLVNINVDTNTVQLVEEETVIDPNTNKEIKGIDLTTDNEYVKNVPTGIWFSEELVNLKRDTNTGYAPSWSLLLSSQFKPFPYSQKIPTEITQDATKEAFATYSQVLIRQNKIMDMFENVSSEVSNIKTYFNDLQSKLNVVSTPYTLDAMHSELISFEKNIEDKLTAFKEEIYSYIANNWKGYIS